MKKLIIYGLAVGALVAFIGTDVVKSAVNDARNGIRDALTSDVPLETRLAEANAKIDAYAENIIEGEVAAANIKDMIAETERDVRSLTVRVEHERETLLALRMELGGTDGAHALVPTSLGEGATAGSDREALRHVQSFRTSSELLARRAQDLERLEAQYEHTIAALEKARAERVRLSEEARVLSAEIESMNARKAAAQTRKAVGDKSIAGSGFAEADKALKEIKSELRKQDKLLRYYEMRDEVELATGPDTAVFETVDASQAIEEALAAYPGR